MNFKLSSILIFLIFTLVGFALYLPSLNYGFYLDDSFQIVTNRLVHDISSWYLNFTRSTVDQGGSEAPGGIYYKPIMMIAYSLLWNITPNETISFRVFQLILHAANASMIFIVFKNLFSKERIIFSLLVGFIFFLHPMNSEAVVFIADLQEPLFSFFGLIALLILIKIQSKCSVYLASIFLLGSVLSKESGLLYILVCCTYYLLFKKDHWCHLIVSLVVVAGVYFTLRFGFSELNAVHSNTMQISRADFLTRLMTMPKVLIHYIHLFFWPQEISLTQDWIVKRISIQDFWLPLIEVIAIVCLSLVYIARTKDKVFILFFLWFGFGWGLHSQLIPLDGTVSDRWFYFTMVGFLGMMMTFISSEFRIQLSRILLMGALLLAGLTLRTHARILNWKDPLTLYTHDLTVDPESFYLNNNAGIEYFNTKRYKQAIPYFEKTVLNTVEKSREWYAGVANLGAIYLFLGQLNEAEGFLRIAIVNGDVKAYRAYAGTLLELNKKKEFFEFLEKIALIKYPNDPVLIKLKNSTGGS